MILNFMMRALGLAANRSARLPITLLAATSFFAVPAQAAVWCDAKITQFYTDSSGNFLVLPIFRGSWVQICSVDMEWKEISLQTCNTWVATVMTGMSTSKIFTMVYTDLSDCLQVPTYSNAPAPAYVRRAQ